MKRAGSGSGVGLFLKLFFIIIFALLLLVAVTQIDDDLSNDAINLVKKIEASGESESYRYLTGIYASKGDSPLDVGSDLLNEYRKKETDDSYEVIEYEDSKKIPLPQGKLFCKAWEDKCLATLFTTDFDVEKLLEENAILVARSNEFHKYNEYKTLTRPSANEQLPPYQYIDIAERLKILQAIGQYQKGKPEVAIEALNNHFLVLRKSMELQDNLVGKFIFLMKLAEILDVSSIMLVQTGFRTHAIPPLTTAERDLELVFAREFGMSYYTFKVLDKHPQFFHMDSKYPGWIIRMVYKPNMTINAITPMFSRLSELARLTPKEFAQKIESEYSLYANSSWLRNYAGDILIGAASPNYEEYLARFMDFDAKISLFNHLHHYQSDVATAENPYYDGVAPEIFENQICFDGPLEDKRFLRCIRTKI